MQRAALVLGVLSVLAPAHAQTQSPAVTSLRWPLALTSTLERDVEMGCSQSFQGQHAVGQVQLRIDAAGAAQLTLDGEAHTTTGPSPGRYMAGDHEFTRTAALSRVTWSGRAAALADGVAIAFDHVSRAQIVVDGYGSAPLPPARRRAFSGEVRCHLGTVDMLPAAMDSADAPTPVPLLRCAWTGAPDAPFDAYTDASPWALGSGPGVRDTVTDTMWSTPSGHVVRRTP